MADPGSKYTDAQIVQMEKQLKSVYNQAYKDILQKQKDFNDKYVKKEAKYAAQLASGQITQEQFDAWKKGQVFQGEQWQNKKKDILNTIYNSNKIAADIVNGKTQGVFTFNANYMSYQLEHSVGINFGFSLYDSATVVNLIKNNPQLLPEWKIDQPKDYTWNQKKLNRQINLGIIEGESLDKIATRLSDSLATQNFNKMRTFARTAMTGAQNSGRQMTLENAKSLGIKLKKEWMATLDAHTRINHRALDGQKVDTDDYFEAGGMKIRYPGDPLADPSMVYNCRCTMVSDIEDYPATYDRYDNIDGKPIKNMTYNEWEIAKGKGENISPIPLTFSHVEKTTPVDNSEFVNLFGKQKMSAVYNDMMDVDKKLSNQFYSELKSMGKPSEIWQQYLNGSLSPDQTQKINDILQNYANKAGLIQQPVNLAEQFANKKMSNIYNDMKVVDTKTANQFYGELKAMGKPSEVWQDYLDGKLSDDQKAKIEAYLQTYTSKLNGTVPQPAAAPVINNAAQKSIKDIKKEVKNIQTLEDAQKATDDIQAILDADPNSKKVFKGIWKNDVTYADYEAKKGAIQAKKDYYIAEIAKLEAAGNHAKADILNDFLKDLEEFETNGKKYSDLYKQLNEAQKQVKNLTPITSSFDPSVYTDTAKSAAYNFTDRDDADRFHRKYVDSMWNDLEKQEQYSVWEYTRNSNPMNKSLSGYHDDWSRSYFIGMDKTDWGHEDSWRSIPSAFKAYGKNGNVDYKSTITNLTTAINKASLPENVYLVRGSDKSGFAGMIEGDLFSFDDATKLLNGNITNLKKALEGQVVQNHAFTSTGIASGTGFDGEVKYRIYAPKGTRGIYAEPQSYYGNTVSTNAKLYKPGQSYSSVGNEAEVILQRGTKFRVINVNQSGTTLNVEMEIVEQPDYFKFGDEDTFNNGATRHKR